jgi:hypothetical protein
VTGGVKVPDQRTPKSFAFISARGAASDQSASTAVSVAVNTGAPAIAALPKYSARRPGLSSGVRRTVEGMLLSTGNPSARSEPSACSTRAPELASASRMPRSGVTGDFGMPL